MEDRETSEEVKRKLEGRLPTLDVPVCIEISLKTTEVCVVCSVCVCVRACVCSECVCV